MIHRLIRLLTLAAAVLVSAWIAYLAPRLGPIEAVENDLADLRVAILNSAQPPHPDIVIATISESTFAHLRQRTPVNRTFLAGLIAALDLAGARAIGIDIFFGEATSTNDDQRLVDALNSVGVPTVLAWADGAAAPGVIAPWQDAAWAEFRAGLDNANISTGLGLLLRDQRDQVVRRMFLARANQDGSRDLGFAAALAAAVDRPLPESLAPLPLAYYGLPRPNQPAFLAIPAESLNPDIPGLWERVQPLIEDRVVLIGLDVSGLDRHATPFALLPDQRGGTAGVEIHAHALAQLLDDRAPPIRPAWLTLVMAVGAALAGALAARMTAHIWLKGLLLLLGPAMILGLGFALFAGGNVMIHILAPNLGYVFAFIATELAMEAHQRREIRLLGGAFARYVSPAVISQLRRDPKRLRLGGEERLITVLLTDLTGSVALAEQLAADRFVSILNGYLDGIARIVLAHDGTIDKYIGDAAMALFGAPLDQPDHGARAVRCARDIDAFARRYAADQRAAGISFGSTRIGVHSDIAIIGNFGGESRFDYTAIGRVTNICARLEAANKQLGTSICVSDDTARRCPDIEFRPIGMLALRGVAEPIMVHAPAAPHLADAAEYAAAYALLDGEPAAARAAFAKLAAAWPDDPLVALHGRRLQAGEAGVTIGLS